MTIMGKYLNVNLMFFCDGDINLQHAIVAGVVSPTHVVNHVVYMKGKE